VPTSTPAGTLIEFTEELNASFPPQKVVLRDAAGRVAGMQERWFHE